MTLTSFTTKILGVDIPNIKSVSILGHKGEVPFSLDTNGLYFKIPEQKIDDKAFVVKIETK